MEIQSINNLLNDQPLNTVKKPQLSEIEGFIETVEAEPTFTPSTFWNSLKIYLGNLFFYDNKNNVWNSLGSKVKTGSGTKSAGTGTTVITTNFKPKLIRITAFQNTSTSHAKSVGTKTADTEQSIKESRYGSNDYVSYAQSAVIIDLENQAGSSEIYANISAISDTGFTINWQTCLSSCVYHWEAIG